MPSTLPEDSYNINKALDNSDEFPSWVQAKQLPNKDGDNSHLQQSDSSLHTAFFWFLHLLKPVGSPLTVGFSLQEWWAPGCQGLSGTNCAQEKTQRGQDVTSSPCRIKSSDRTLHDHPEGHPAPKLPWLPSLHMLVN